MASATITIADTEDEQVSIKLSFGTAGTDPASPAHHAAVVALEAIGRHLSNAHEPLELVAHLRRQREFSERTFGPGPRAAGVIAHIRRELVEIEANPGDVTEWIDVVLLAFDGAWRAGFSPEQIAEALTAKQAKNETRDWPDWRAADPDQPIEHVRPGDHIETPA